MTITTQLQKDVILAPFTTFGVGGPADYFIATTSIIELVDSVQWAKESKLPYFVLGTGANILVGDKGFRGLVIKNEAREFQIKQNDTITLTAQSGALMGDLIRETAKRGLSGLEHYAGIPSTVGGAMWQNLHFYGPDRKTVVFIADILQGATILTENSEIKKVDANYFAHGYDQSILHIVKDIVLEVTFELTPESKTLIQERIDANLAWRNEKHPKGATSHSAGSVFRNIPGHGAGRLIDRAGLKGKKIGGAEVSLQHANFIMNTGNATAKDIRELVTVVQESIKKEMGLNLEPEISFVGEF